MTKIALRQIYKTYNKGKSYALKNISYSIEDNDFFVLIGPSGCGKTTMLDLIAGLKEPTSGEIYIDDIKMNGVAPKNRDVAMVFQDFALYPHMTVKENLEFSLKNQKLRKEIIKERLDKYVQILNIEELLDRYPNSLSGGQKQRVALGRAIIRHPKILLMDEPLANLDPVLKVQIREEIRKIHKVLDIVIIYVTHDQTEALSLGTRIALLKEGEIVQVDIPTSLIFKPKNEFVATFLGNPPMNIVRNIKLNDKTEGYNFNLFGEYFYIEFIEDIASINNYIDVGIRPEDILIKIKKDGIEVSIEYVEMIGVDCIVCGKINNSEIIRVKTNLKNIKDYDEKIYINIKENNLYFFDHNTKKALNIKTIIKE